MQFSVKVFQVKENLTKKRPHKTLKAQTWGMSHSGELWARLNQMLKVEQTMSLENIRRWCVGVPVWDLCRTLREMEAARVVTCKREWIDQTHYIELYTYAR